MRANFLPSPHGPGSRPRSSAIRSLAPTRRSPTCARGGCRARRCSYRAMRWSPPRLGVTNHPLDRGKAQAQRALEVVDALVHVGDGECGIDIGVEVDDLAVRGLA